MSEPSAQAQPELLAEKGRQGRLTRIVVILLLICASYILIGLVCIPKFEQLYQDALPGYRLPGLTQWIIAGRIPIMIIGAVWPIVAILNIRRLKLTSVLLLYLLMGLSFGEILITTYALIRPLIGLATYMSDATPSP